MFQVHIILTMQLSSGHTISYPTHELKWTINKPITGLIGLGHVHSGLKKQYIFTLIIVIV